MPAVLLLHTLPDGSRHYDWMFSADTQGRLTTFRLDVRPDESDDFVATRLPDHRDAYLTYEGPVSGERGHVRRVAQGRTEARQHQDGLHISLDFGGPTIHILGTPDPTTEDPARWRFRRTLGDQSQAR